jgi:hypothetical protein
MGAGAVLHPAHSSHIRAFEARMPLHNMGDFWAKSG